MPLVICALRQSILDAQGPVLVTGGPGSGKTTIALAKAQRMVEAGMSVGQSVLFLSFSRAAVTRVIEAGRAQLSPDTLQKISIQTFHSFLWQILNSYGYLLGAPRTLKLLLPHDEAASRFEFEEHGGDWASERERLFLEDGRVPFDLFAPKALALLLGSQRLKWLFSARHPLIIVDEAQDTADDQWQCIRLLSESSQVLCLADLDQQIYDFRPGVSSDRLVHIMASLQPLRVDLGSDNHRSPSSEIVAFGNDILLNSPRGAPYRGVSRFNYRANRDHRDLAIRRSIGMVNKLAAKAAGRDTESIAVLATWGRGVNVISRALTGDGSNRIPHRVMIDEASVLLSSRVVAFMIEPGRERSEELSDVADGLDLIAAVFRARGSRTALETAQTLTVSAIKCRLGTSPRGNTVASKFLHTLRQLRSRDLSGDPRLDWLEVRDSLRRSGAKTLVTVAEDAEQLAAFQRGRRIASSLEDLWHTHGSYRGARAAFDVAMTEEQLFSGEEELRGIHVMTVHKAKGKEFDAVVIFDSPNSSPLVFSKEAAPYNRCRKLVRVAVTRAKHHVLMLCDAYTPTELLSGHKL